MDYENMNTRQDDYDKLVRLDEITYKMKAVTLVKDDIVNNDQPLLHLIKQLYAYIKENIIEDDESVTLPVGLLDLCMFCSYATLFYIIKQAFIDNRGTDDEELVDTYHEFDRAMHKLNKTLWDDYWYGSRSENAKENRKLIKKHILKFSKMRANFLCFRFDNKKSDRSADFDDRCNDCLIDSVYTGIGRMENPCHNTGSQINAESSFINKNLETGICTHNMVLITDGNCRTKYDDLIFNTTFLRK